MGSSVSARSGRTRKTGFRVIAGCRPSLYDPTRTELVPRLSLYFHHNLPDLSRLTVTTEALLALAATALLLLYPVHRYGDQRCFQCLAQGPQAKETEYSTMSASVNGCIGALSFR